MDAPDLLSGLMENRKILVLSLVASAAIVILLLGAPRPAEKGKTLPINIQNADENETYTVDLYDEDGTLIRRQVGFPPHGIFTFEGVNNERVIAKLTDSTGRSWTSGVIEVAGNAAPVWSETTNSNPHPLSKFTKQTSGDAYTLVLPRGVDAKVGNAIHVNPCCTIIDIFTCQNATCARTDCNLSAYGDSIMLFQSLSDCRVYDLSKKANAPPGVGGPCQSYEITVPSLCYKGASHEFNITIQESLSGCESADYSVSASAAGQCSVSSPQSKTIVSGKANTLSILVTATPGQQCEVSIDLHDPTGGVYTSKLVLYDGADDHCCSTEAPLYCSFPSLLGDLNNDMRITQEDFNQLAAFIAAGNPPVNQYTDFNGDRVVDDDDLLCMETLLSGDAVAYARHGCPESTEGMLVRNCELCGCPPNQSCSDNECVQPDLLNAKDMQKYSSREAFLISDGDWRAVLPLIPVSTWTGQESECQSGSGTPQGVCAYPILIYHEEGSGFDADSIISFLRTYEPTSLEVVGDTPSGLYDLLIAPPNIGAGLAGGLGIQEINPTEYLDFWSSYRDVVYVTDDYKTALMAATYASLLNAPLIIEGTPSDTKGAFAGRNVTCVGITGDCDEYYSLEALQKKYLELTGTSRLVLVNPNDLGFAIPESFIPSLSPSPIGQIYGKASLASPALAAAKHELLVFYDTVNSPIEPNGYCKKTNIEPIIEDVNRTLNAMVTSLFTSPPPIVQGKTTSTGAPIEYLTIVAAPNAIPDSQHYEGSYCDKNNTHGQRLSTDRRLLPGTKTGRIYSVTISDVSSYVARSLFYDYLFSKLYGDTHNGLLVNSVIMEDTLDDWLTMSDSIEMNRILSQNGYDISCIWIGLGAASSGAPLSDCTVLPKPPDGESLVTNVWTGKQLIINWGHGSPNGWGDVLLSKHVPELGLPYVHAFSCSTAHFWPAADSQKRAERFAPTLIRKGAMAYHGLVGQGSSSPETCPECIPKNALVAVGKLVTDPETTLGELDLYLYQETSTYSEQGFNFFILLGDPTLQLNFKQVPEWPVVEKRKEMPTLTPVIVG